MYVPLVKITIQQPSTTFNNLQQSSTTFNNLQQPSTTFNNLVKMSDEPRSVMTLMMKYGGWPGSVDVRKGDVNYKLTLKTLHGFVYLKCDFNKSYGVKMVGKYIKHFNQIESIESFEMSKMTDEELNNMPTCVDYDELVLWMKFIKEGERYIDMEKTLQLAKPLEELGYDMKNHPFISGKWC